eukprot:258952_1
MYSCIANGRRFQKSKCRLDKLESMLLIDTCDKDNHKKWTEISNKYSKTQNLETQETVHDSAYLLDKNAQKVMFKEDTCSLSNCEHLRRLVYDMKRYHLYIDQCQNYNEQKQIDFEISMKDTLNDFHHLLG